MTRVKKAVHSKNSVYVYMALVASMSSIFGFNLGSILSSKVRLINIFMLEIYDVDSMINTFLLGAFIGTFLGGRLVADTGRIFPLLGAFCVGVIGQCTSILSPTFSTLFISEFSVGASFGVYLIASVCYVTELAPYAHRGSSCALITVFLSFGLLLSALLRGIIPNYGIACASVIIAISIPVIIICYVRLPESPRWLAMTSSSDKALTELIRLRQSTSEAAKELAAINECVLGEERGLSLFFRSHIFRSLVWFFVFVTIACQISGMAIIPYMSLQFVKSYQSALTLGVLIPVGNNEINFTFLGFILFSAFAGALITFLLVDRIGRRKLLLAAILLNEAVIATIYVLLYGHLISVGQYTVMFLICLYVIGSTVSMTMVMGIISSELLAAKGREFGLTVIYLTNFAAIMLGMYFFHRAVLGFGLLMLFSFFLLAGAFLFSLIFSALPESSNKLLENMENRIFNQRSLHSIKNNKNYSMFN